MQTPTTKTFLAIGDSKTVGECGQPCWHHDGFELPLSQLIGYRELQPRLGHSGWNLFQLAANFENDVKTVKEVPDFILIDIGTNDMRPGLSVTFWNEWGNIYLDYVQRWHTQFPNARIYLAFPRNYAPYSDADFWPMDQAIRWVIKDANQFARQDYVFEGTHESTFLRDNSVDHVHPNPKGYLIEAQEWRKVLP